MSPTVLSNQPKGGIRKQISGEVPMVFSRKGKQGSRKENKKRKKKEGPIYFV